MLNPRVQVCGQFRAEQIRAIPRVMVLLGLFATFSQLPSSADSPRGGLENLRFSHRFHLTETKATCQECHASAWSSNSSLDNNLPSEKNCLQCHDGAGTRKECTLCHADPKTAHPFQIPARNFRFDHKLHGTLGNLAPIIAAAIDSGKYLSSSGKFRKQLDTGNPCVACHRGLEATNYTSAANLPQMADCLVCHTEIDPPFSCQFCHTKEAQTKPPSHTHDYIDLHTSGKVKLDKQSCKICHGTRFRCMGCH